jgi:hypothetical protein
MGEEKRVFKSREMLFNGLRLVWSKKLRIVARVGPSQRAENM